MTTSCINKPQKLPSKYENPIDEVLTKYAMDNMHAYHNIGFNPNGITTLSLSFSLLSMYFLYIRQYEISALCYLTNYYYDCMDGAMARCYDEVTQFGDYYDHATDIIGFIILFLLVTCYFDKKCSRKHGMFVFMIMMLLSVLVLVHVGLQEIYYDENKNSADLFSKMLRTNGIKTKEDAEKYMPYTRYFGCGTYHLVFSVFIFMLRFCK